MNTNKSSATRIPIRGELGTMKSFLIPECLHLVGSSLRPMHSTVLDNRADFLILGLAIYGFTDLWAEPCLSAVGDIQIQVVPEL